MVVQWLVLPPHSKKVVGSIPGLGPLCVEFSCSLCVCWLLSEASDFLSHSRNMRVESIEHCELSVSVNDCSSLCDPVMNSRVSPCRPPREEADRKNELIIVLKIFIKVTAGNKQLLFSSLF